MIKVALTGPECSGKTTLAIDLGKELGVNWIPEFARHYLNKLERAYNQADLDFIAEKQQDVIRLISNTSSNYLVVDTEMLVLKIWSLEKYNSVSDFISSAWQYQDLDLYVLCKPDIPFEQDGLRENPDDRDRLFEIYKNELRAKNANFIIVSGNQSNRLGQVLEAISKLKKT